MKKISVVCVFFVLGLLSSCKTESKENSETQADSTATSPKENVVNVYSHRHYEIDQQLYDEFTKQTGIKVNVIKAKADQLLQRIKQEGASSPADLLITVDAGSLARIKNDSLFQTANSEILSKQIPAYLRDSDNQWFGLTQRARVIVYNKAKLKQLLLHVA